MTMERLCFCSAAFGSWGIVRLGTLVPDCHMLFICPYSCGRHNSIGAIQHGYKDKISYLFIDERDLALGTMAEDIPAAVAHILNTLPRRPRVLLLYFSCVLYMSGFDWDASVELLRETYPEIRFRACMMNPVAGDTKRPPVPAMVQTLCSLWDTAGPRQNTVNLLGPYGQLDAGCELAEVLRRCGCGSLLHFTDAGHFDAYSRMGRSRYNLVTRPEGLLAAQGLKETIPFCFVPVSYDLAQIHQQYEDIFAMVGRRADMMPYRKAAEASIRETLALIGHRAVAVGSSAVCRPFSLARALIRYGFTVSDVFFEDCPPFEREARDELIRRGGVQFHDIHAPECADQIGTIGQADIAIGYSAGYYTGASHVADLMIDEGMFGYGGVVRLMSLLQKAVLSPTAVETMIESYGLIV